MALQPRSTALHNRMLGRLIKHPKSTNFDDDNSSSPRPAKRIKRFDSEDTSDRELTPSSPKLGSKESKVSDDEADNGTRNQLPATPHQTDLESALPPVKTDKEAIEEYEAYRAAEAANKPGLEHRLNERKWIPGKSSIYVDAFNLALDTVLSEESHLFNEAEMALFQDWQDLSYEAQYLYVRLFLRKTSAWHRISMLGYYDDIADIGSAVEALQCTRDLPALTEEAQVSPGELEPPEGTTLGPSYTFADKSEEEISTLEEASSLLKLDELKILAKDAKVQGKNKSELLKALRRSSGKQAGLGWTALRRSDTEASEQSLGSGLDDDLGESSQQSYNGSGGNRDSYFVRKIMEETGSCIRLNLAPLKLFERVHLVFYRSTEWTEKSLTTIILARVARRNFPEYIVSRSANIFPSRSLLLEFEASLRTQYRVDSILEFNGRPTPESLQAILDITEEVFPRWRALVQEERKKEDSIYHSGEGAYLRRLSPAWVYTRIIHKAAYVLGKLKQYKREYELLTELLTQRLFHGSRRGAWYQRKALLEEHYMASIYPAEGRGDDAQKKHWKRIALITCEDGLQDPLVHLIYHYDLQKRVSKLERALRVAKRAQHDFTHVRLAAAVEVTIAGIRVERETPPLSRRTSLSNTRNSSPHPAGRRSGGKTIWLDPLEGFGECSVEAMCLSHYRAQGWKGYHSEGGIVRTLFAYLFFDVLFAYVPNVFQTPYQTCPLDLHTDAFYASRLSEINHRLVQIGNGGAEGLVRKVWEEHAERRTCVVGLDWAFELEDLLEIVGCFDGQALATVCKVLAQEYGQRGGGVPDLFLWHPERKEVLFAEVKSENDRLSDTQRLWIHVLTGAGVRVELCNAVAKEVRKVP